METEQIIEKIFANPEGGTAPLYSEELPSIGYYVGGLASPLILSTPLEYVPDARWDAKVFINYLREYVACQYVGWWSDSETGKVWIDATTWHTREFTAEKVARERREIAIYDIHNDRELRIAYTEGGLS